MRTNIQDNMLMAMSLASIDETLENLSPLLPPTGEDHDCHASPEDGCDCGKEAV